MTTTDATDACKISIISVDIAAILDAPNSADLVRAYADECLVSDAHPQRLIYAALEQAGALRCFGAYVDRLAAPSLLIGFASLLFSNMPHHGHRLATVESIFVDPAYRETGAGNRLLAAVEHEAADTGCIALVYTVRRESRLATILSRRFGCELTHQQYTKWLNGYAGKDANGYADKK